MTHCKGAPPEEWFDFYLQGILPELEKLEFERHYFDCPDCLARLQALEEVSAQLARHPMDIPRAPLSWPMRLSVLAAIAAVIVIGLITFQRVNHRPASSVAGIPKAVPQQNLPSPQAVSPAAPAALASPLSQLADLALPPYPASISRGEGENASFEAGMTAYRAGDCRRAITTLSAVPAADQSARAAQFYSGTCEMHEGNLAVASTSLRHVADAGNSPQQEAAWFYLAQIALARNNADDARNDLDITISLHGDFERRAHAELAAIPRATGSR